MYNYQNDTNIYLKNIKTTDIVLKPFFVLILIA